jgi:hypothetical protein
MVFFFNLLLFITFLLAFHKRICRCYPIFLSARRRFPFFVHFCCVVRSSEPNDFVIAINIPSDVMTIITTADVGLKSELVERGF